MKKRRKSRNLILAARATRGHANFIHENPAAASPACVRGSRTKIIEFAASFISAFIINIRCGTTAYH